MSDGAFAASPLSDHAVDHALADLLFVVIIGWFDAVRKHKAEVVLSPAVLGLDPEVPGKRAVGGEVIEVQIARKFLTDKFFLPLFLKLVSSLPSCSC